MFRIAFTLMLNIVIFDYSFAALAPQPWKEPEVSENIAANILYLPIADENVKKIKIRNKKERLIDLIEINNPRLIPLSTIDPSLPNTYKEFSFVREEVYNRLQDMLRKLPDDIGIAYFEGLRPLWKQKEYFDKKFRENLEVMSDKEAAYNATTISVSPFIDNVPTHATGAAIDITLFKLENSVPKVLDMGMFDTIYGENNQQETFSPNTTDIQRENRIILLQAATNAGFVNYGHEWWHYSFGDRAWGYVKNRDALYGLAVEKNDPILQITKESYLRDFK
jgi:zinc D-Ala-D-Ala dipeptidase